MIKKIISVILTLVLTVSAFAGCSKNNPKTPVNSQKSKPQLVVALNPILSFASGVNKIAFNDVKNAMGTDKSSATLTSLSDTTSWVWAYKQGDDLKKRGTYGIDKWRNGGLYSADKLSAYSFMDDGTISLMPYTTAVANLTTYQGETPPEAGILLSVSGNEEEAFCCQITESGALRIPAGKITAIQSVGGVKTGFLAEDGTERSAVVKFVLNTKVVWSGQFMNSTAGNGTAVTELYYPDFSDLQVEAGDIFFISMQLDAQLNEQEDITPDTDTDIDSDNNSNNDWNDGYYDGDTSIDDSNSSVNSNDTDSNGDVSSKPEEKPNKPTKPENNVTQISLIDGYDSRFKIVYPKDATITQKQIITKMREQMVDIFEADVLTNNDMVEEAEYEILIGRTNRKESTKAYNALTDYRVNNGSDFIIRMDGKKLVIAANTDYSLQLATDYFMANYCKSDKDSIASNLNFVSRPKLGNIIIGDTNIASYTIRTEKYPSIMTVKAAHKLAEYVVQKTGYSLKIEKDTKKTDNEILIGLTRRSDISANTFKTKSLDFLKGKNGNKYNNEDYNIFIDGSKLFLEAGSDYAANCAVLKLINALEKNSVFKKSKTISGSYKKGEYTLIDDYAYTWGDEFYSTSGTTMSKKNWKVMEKGYLEDEGCWYEKDDPYYLASKKSLEDNDPDNDFGGPWLETSDPKFVQEGISRNLSSNVAIRNNMLVQTSKKESYGYSGSVICTDGRMEFRYGILESRVMLATNNGNAACFWTRTKDGGSVVNEMDMVENFGMDKFRPNLHTWAETHTNHGEMITVRETCEPEKGENFGDTFHHIALEWTPDFINMYLDGEIYLSQDITSDTWYAFRETTYVIFNSTAPSALYAEEGNPGNWLAGGDVAPREAAKLFDTNKDGKVDIEDFCEEQIIDYVRLYQINSREYSLKAKK